MRYKSAWLDNNLEIVNLCNHEHRSVKTATQCAFDLGYRDVILEPTEPNEKPKIVDHWE